VTKEAPAPAGSRGPRHVAIIMDGNGRWAQQRGRPRGYGHTKGVQSARRILRACHRNGVEALTVFAFSQENWARPEQEVSLLMGLFLRTLSKELDTLHRNGVRLRFLGVAVGYGGEWDIAQAAAACVRDKVPLDPEHIEARLQTAGLPEVDLLIRTGGERRLSNFMLWQLAYSELYFTDTLWPDFREDEFVRALEWFRTRQRRFGRVPEAA
jgi:undecaprenyl diphosphate synthase